jgi:dGTPase
VQQFAPDVQPVLEAQIVDFADEIAYNSHDIDDGLKSEMLEEKDLAGVALWSEARELVRRQYADASESIQRYQTVRRIIDRLVTDMIEAVHGRIDHHRIRTLADVRACAIRLAGLSPEMAKQNRELKQVLLDRLYRHHRITRMTMKAGRVMSELFHTYMDEPQQMPPHVHRRIEEGEPQPRVVADYIAGMTDRFAVREHERLSGHSPFAEAV